MSTVLARPTAPRFEAQSERPTRKQHRSDIWTSLLKQTQIAQSRNRSDAIAHRRLLVCGGSPEDQQSFLSFLTRPPPPQRLLRSRNEQPGQKERGGLALSNRYAYGYGHFSIFSAQQGGIGAAALGPESEEIARLQCHCIPEPDARYETVLRRLLTESSQKLEEDSDEDDLTGQDADQSNRRPAVQILLSWREPWLFLQKLRAWLQLLARSVLPPSTAGRDEDPVDVLKEHNISITIIVQHVEAQQDLEREGWVEETFDYVGQVLRTILLPLQLHAALVYTPSIPSPQQPGSSLTEIQKVIFTALELNLATLSPRPASSGTGASGAIKREELLPRHNVVDRMNIVIPAAWDSAGKIRLLSEIFSPEELLTAWSLDLSKSVLPTLPLHTTQDVQVEVDNPAPQREVLSNRQAEEVFSAEPESPISSAPSVPPSPTKAAPSAIAMFEAQIVDPNAHKAVKPPTIVVVTRPEQEFLHEMKLELDSFAAKDRERAAATAGASPSVAGRFIGIPAGESTGALDSLGDVSFNVGGVSYNAEAAIERLKRPPPPGALDSSSPLGSSRTSTPRPPRRLDLGERDSTPGASTPASSKTDFPGGDLEKYFASLAKKAGGADSRQGTPSRT